MFLISKAANEIKNKKSKLKIKMQDFYYIYTY